MFGKKSRENMSSGVSSPDQKKSGCGLLGAVFGGTKKFWPRRATSTGSLPSQHGSLNDVDSPKRIPSDSHNSKKRRGSFDDLDANSSVSSQPSSSRGGPKPQQKCPPVRLQQQQQHQQQQQQHHVRRPSSNDTTVVQASRSLTPAQNQNRSNDHNTKKMPPKEALGISGELEMMIAEHQKGRGGINLVRASSGNVMVQSSLGNLRQPGGSPYTYKPASNGKPEEQQAPKNIINFSSKYSNSGMGNIVNKKQIENGEKATGGTSLCRALSCRMDPEELKILGNEDYKNGNFAEALALYERAIDLDPSKASYRSNKSAALTALGRLLEAVFECREAIGIEPHYHRAHHRLANLYLRLGEAEKAIYHFKRAGPEADPDTMSKAKLVLGHMKKCEEAKRLKDWHTVLRESGNTIGAGADSAPMIFALQAEAYLKLHRPQDAVATWENGPDFDVDQCTKLFGSAGNAMLLLIRAQVDMAAGRFDDAMEAIQHAGRLDPSNREVGVVTRRARAVSNARARGNDLFNESRFSEACVAYGQGLEHDPQNSVLLCNRAACRAKLRQFEKAIEDCTAALNARPSYTKARLRRADCNVKLQKWEAAVRDYEILFQESPGDEDMAKAFFKVEMQLKKQRGEDVSNLQFGNDCLVKIHSDEHFKSVTSWPGLSVALFCNKPGERQTLQFIGQLCKRYQTIKFLKVEVEDSQNLVKSEGVGSLPAFKIYQSGSRVKEIRGEDHESLECSIKEYTS
ncbi:TPR repeat-containing thioredoxin TTL1-like [Chenopodium quinoa]|uniref:TPR repeat-containing thioredoxin TTL1-like n=1 Tax=Chenopodium quinoa TaxID=63459 RepID=UPI000B7764A0|nr:TPR repeat-containing thioredoxin TTL1-like [Chenopodium quinoa]